MSFIVKNICVVSEEEQGKYHRFMMMVQFTCEAHTNLQSSRL
jgi:hypothetical protein